MAKPEESNLSDNPRWAAWRQRVSQIGERLASGNVLHEQSKLPAMSPSPEVDQQLKRFNEAAALSGRFSPDQVFDSAVDNETRVKVLSRARAEHSVEIREGKLHWMLLPEPRRVVVNDLVASRALEQRLSGPLPITDEYGTVLRDVLRLDVPVDPIGKSADELRILKSVVDDLKGASVQLPDSDDIRARLASSSFLSDYQVLTDHFVGREKELQKLHGFLDSPSKTPQWKGLILTGLGGAGKSALLAKFAVDVAKAGRATVVVLDFDRPGVDASDTRWLQDELARQLGQQYPESGQRLRNARAQSRETAAHHVRQSHAANERSSVSRSSDDLLFDIKGALQMRGDRPLLLVLDTLEELLSSDSRYSLLEWISALSSILHPVPIRVIFSGRLFDESLDIFKRTNIDKMDEITLSELEEGPAAELLESYGVNVRLAQQLVNLKLLPRRPLELKLLARLAQTGDASVAQLEKDLRKESKSSREAARAIIYQRILRRLPEGLVREIASPGLILRYVDVKLIQEVLEPALKLSPVSEKQAQGALNELAQRTWLVSRDSQGQLWHRRDLRASMLQLMLAKRNSRNAISKFAIKHFLEQRSEREQAEATYHKLLLAREPADCDDFNLKVLASQVRYFQNDLQDLPPPASALCRYALKRSIQPAEMLLLPDRYLHDAYEETGRRLVALGEFGQAAKLMARAKAADKRQLEPWEAQTLFATMQWSKLRAARSTREYPRPSALNFQGLADYVYPYELALAVNNASYVVEAKLSQLARSRRWTAPGDLGSTVAALAAGLVMLNHRRPLRPVARKQLSVVINAIQKRQYRALSAFVGHRTFLLSMLSDRPVNRGLRLSSSTLVLRRPFLESLRNDPAMHRSRSLIDTTIQRLYHSSTPLTAHAILSNIDSLRRSDVNLSSTPVKLSNDSNPGLLAMLRAFDVDFRNPVRFAIVETLKTSSAMRRLAQIMRSLLDMPVAELDEPEIFVDMMNNDAEHALESHIELIDRSCNLIPFIDALATARPKAKPLGELRRAMHKWDRAVEQLLKKQFPRFPTRTAVTVPVQNSVRVGSKQQATGTPFASPSGRPNLTSNSTPGSAPAGLAAVVVDQSDYNKRPGFDSSFLGASGLRIPLPKLSASAKRLVAPVKGNSAGELRYWNYTVMLNKARRLAFFSAVNVDATLRPKDAGGDGDQWYVDTRIDAKYQLDQSFYGKQRSFEATHDRSKNPFDRGHLTSRLDAQWGADAATSSRNGNDSFHFTNCAPQHWKYNQGAKKWLGFEDYVISMFADGVRACVINGPVFDAPLSALGTDGRLVPQIKGKRHRDPKFGGIAIPKLFFKVVACRRNSSKLSVAAFLMSQEDLLRTMGNRLKGLPPVPEGVLTDAEAKLYQVRVKDVEALTGMNFGIDDGGGSGRPNEVLGLGAPRLIEEFDELKL